jgi:chromosome transmission fidelity protein 4
LASGTCDGDVIVWDVAKKAVSQRVHVAPNWAICAIEFVGETIITLDTEGYISWIPNVPASVVLQDEEMMQTADEPIYEDNVDFEEESRTKRFCPNDDNDSVSDVVYESASNRISMETSKDILAFQSSEAPRDLANRFMAYNLVGLVRSHQNNVSGVSSVEVEFHDASLHHSLTIPNQFDYEMASLTESALCLACTSGNGHGSQLYCICFQEQDAGREWTLPMPKKEEIKAIAQGDDWIAVATSHHFLRIISLGGIQQQLFSIPGPVITLAAHGEKLAIVFQGDTCNRYRLCIAETSSYVPKINVVDLPLSPGSTLKWMGYSPSGVLSTYDSIGILRVAVSSSMTWIPALDTKSDLSSKHDTYFGVGLSESPEEFRCILCKGTPYPPVQPRPVMISVPLKIPVCEVATERGQLEEEFIRSVSLAPSEHTMLAKTLTKMFAMSCKCGRKRRALDVARLFPNWQMLELPMTYCRKNQLHALCDKISQLIDKKKGNEGLRVTFSDDEDDDDDDDVVDNGISAIKKGSSQKIADLPISADKGIWS